MKVSKSRKGPGITAKKKVMSPMGYYFLGAAIAAAKAKEDERKRLEEKLRGDNAPKRRKPK